MFRELLSIFRTSDPLRDMGDNFGRMLQLTRELTLSASRIFFGEIEGAGGPERAMLYEREAQVNALEQTIRRQIVTHLSVSGHEAEVPYSLLLMSLVKDVERVGDYAKNLAQIVDLHAAPLPLGSALDVLLAIRRQVEQLFASVPEVFEQAERDEAMALIRAGRATTRRCDQLIADVGRGTYDAGTTAAMILGARYYKRIGGHLLNVLTGVVMPLDKVDYYDEPAS